MCPADGTQHSAWQLPDLAREEPLADLLVPALLPHLYVSVQPGHVFLVEASYSISSSARHGVSLFRLVWLSPDIGTKLLLHNWICALHAQPERLISCLLYVSHIFWLRKHLIISLWLQLTLENTGLNCTGPLIGGFFSIVNTTYYTITSWLNPQIQRNCLYEGPYIHGFSTVRRVGALNPHIVQGSTVLIIVYLEMLK